MQRKTIELTLLSVAVIALSGCGGGGSSEDPKESVTPSPTKTEVRGIPTESFEVVTCGDPSDSGCLEARAFDLQKQTVAILNPPKEIGVGEYAMFKGKRFGVVPKEEKEITPLNMVAYGLWLYAQEMGEKWCGPCKMTAPASYADAKRLLKEQFGLTGTKAQNEALLRLINDNLEHLGEQQIPLKEAYFADIKALAAHLVTLTKAGNAPDLSGLHLVKDAKGKVVGVSSTPSSDCPEYLGGCIDSWGRIDKKEALDIRESIMPMSSGHARAFETLTCESNEDKIIYMYGVEDDFDMTNSEPVNPQGQLLSNYNAWPSQSTYDNNTSMPYIDANGNSVNTNILWFAETLGGLPTTMTKGRMAIGLKRIEKTTESNSVIMLANATFTDGTQIAMPDPTVNGWSHIANTHTYYQDLDQLTLSNANIDFLQYIQSGNDAIDVAAIGYIDIDYIAVGACVPHKPDGIPVPEVPVKLACNEKLGESLVTIWGGDGDNFLLPIDPTTPPTGLNNTIKYDEVIKKRGTFADRIAFAPQVSTQQSITKAEIMVNTRPGANGYQNDQMILGDYTTLSGVLHNPNDGGVVATQNGGIAHEITAYGSTPLNGGSGTLLSLLNNTHYLDVIVKDQTQVDAVRVSLCVVDTKEGDLNITKKAGRHYTKDGIHYANFTISVGGTLPYSETLTINEIVPSGAFITWLPPQSPWICSQTTPPTINGPTTIQCHITAINGDMNTIPPLYLTMASKSDKIINCANIDSTSQNVSFNTNPKNDESCESVIFEPPFEGNLAIKKRVIEVHNEQGVNSATFAIGIDGTLPANHSVTFDEVIPSGAQLTQITVPQQWNCPLPSPLPIMGQATIYCSITAGNSAITNIPDVIVKMRSKGEKLQNCANIAKTYSGVFYNTDPKDDKSCTTAIFHPTSGCTQRNVVDLSNPAIWRDSSGNSATAMSPINAYWDSSYTWLNASGDYTKTIYKTENFCACGHYRYGNGYINVTGMKTDNNGKIGLINQTQNIGTVVASQSGLTMNNFTAQYPGATGNAIIHNGKTYQVVFKIYNETWAGGGAVKGDLVFTGHWGKCSKFDIPLDSDTLGPIDLDPIIYTDINGSGGIDENTTVAVINPTKSTAIDPDKYLDLLPQNRPQPVTIVKGSDLVEVKTTPERTFGDRLPSNYTLVIGCLKGYVTVATKGVMTRVYESSVKCEGEWVKYLQ